MLFCRVLRSHLGINIIKTILALGGQRRTPRRKHTVEESGGRKNPTTLFWVEMQKYLHSLQSLPTQRIVFPELCVPWTVCSSCCVDPTALCSKSQRPLPMGSVPSDLQRRAVWVPRARGGSRREGESVLALKSPV